MKIKGTPLNALPCRHHQICDDIHEVVITSDQITQAIQALACRIQDTYANHTCVVMAFLSKGASPFANDLKNALNDPKFRFVPVHVSIYQGGTESTGEIVINRPDMPDVTGQAVLIVDDIYDSGLTLKQIKAHLEASHPADVKTCVMFEKDCEHKHEVALDFVGLSVPDEFIVGYGLDYQERYRELRCVGILKPPVTIPRASTTRGSVSGYAGVAPISGGPDAPAYLAPSVPLEGLANAYLSLSRLNERRGDYDSAEAVLHQSIELFHCVEQYRESQGTQVETASHKTMSEEYIALRNRFDCFLALVSESALRDEVRAHFSEDERRTVVHLILTEEWQATVSDHTAFMHSFDSLYKIFLTLMFSDYFISYWLENRDISVSENHDLRVHAVTKASPEKVEMSGVAIAIKAVADVLSIGKQYAAIRTAHLEIRRKELEIVDAEEKLRTLREAERTKRRTLREKAELELETKRLENEKLRNSLAEQEARIRKLQILDWEDSLALLQKAYPVLQKMPDELRKLLTEEMQLHVNAIRSSPYTLSLEESKKMETS